MIEIPSLAVIISYEMVFRETAPKTKDERIKLINHIPKVKLIHEFASLNYRLRAYNEFAYKYDYQTQFNELFYFCGASEVLYNFYEYKILQYIEDYNKKGNQIVIFNRPSNLFALQEIILYGAESSSENFEMYNVWNDI
ncbi:MAG: hypothetical protein ACK4TA_18000, partial [Saprospiraceae bacterium]